MVKKNKIECYDCKKMAKIKVNGISTSYYCNDCYKNVLSNEIYFTSDNFKTLRYIVGNTTTIV
jgi:hypothetical protein